MASCTSVTMLMLSGSLGSYMMLLGAYSLSVQGAVFLGVMHTVNGAVIVVVVAASQSLVHGHIGALVPQLGHY